MILYMNLPLRYEGKVIFEYLTIIEKERLLRFGSRVTPLLLFCYYFSFNHDRTGRIFAVVDTARMRVNDQKGGAVGSWQLFHRAVNICFPSAERPFSTFP